MSADGLPEDWREVLEEAIADPAFAALERFVADERRSHEVFPPASELYAAFVATPFADVRVVILGQQGRVVRGVLLPAEQLVQLLAAELVAVVAEQQLGRRVGVGDAVLLVGRDEAGRHRVDHVLVEGLQLGEVAGDAIRVIQPPSRGQSFDRAGGWSVDDVFADFPRSID